jgi:hypothetical protein
MAFDVTGLTNYTKEESLNLLTKAMFTAKTARLLQGAGQVLPGIKSAEILPLLYSDVYFQSDSCSYQTSGNTTLSKRTLTVGKVKVQETLCPKDLETKYTQKALAAGEAIDMGVFTEQIGAEKAAKIAEAIETSIWQGDTTGGAGNLGYWDGFLTILGDLGFGGAGDPIKGNVANAYASITASNIDDIITTIYSVIPAELLGKPDLMIAMGTDTFRLYRQWLVTANLFHYPANEIAEMEIVDPITGIKIYGLHGMNGTNKIVAGLWSNFFLGTDMMNEEEEFEFIFNPFERRVQFHTAFKYGCQVAYPEQVVLFTL